MTRKSTVNNSLYEGTSSNDKNLPAAGEALQPRLDTLDGDLQAQAKADGAANGTIEQVAGGLKRGQPLQRGSDVEIAGRIERELTRHFGTVPYSEGKFWRYVGSHWDPIPRDELRGLVHACDDLKWGPNCRAKVHGELAADAVRRGVRQDNGPAVILLKSDRRHFSHSRAKRVQAATSWITS
jgi:hypothetical protein